MKLLLSFICTSFFLLQACTLPPSSKDMAPGSKLGLNQNKSQSADGPKEPIPDDGLPDLARQSQALTLKMTEILKADFKSEHVCWDLGSLAIQIKLLNTEVKSVSNSTTEFENFWTAFQKFSPQVANSLLFNSTDFSLCPTNSFTGLRTDFENLLLPWLEQMSIGSKSKYLIQVQLKESILWNDLLGNIETDINNTKNLIQATAQTPLGPDELLDQEFHGSAWIVNRNSQLTRTNISSLSQSAQNHWKMLNAPISDLKFAVFVWKGDYESGKVLTAALDKVLVAVKQIKDESTKKSDIK